MGLVCQLMCLFTTQLLLHLYVYTQMDGQAELAWKADYRPTTRDGLQLPIAEQYR